MPEGRLWCPTRGYFEIGAGGAAKAPVEAPAAEAAAEPESASAPAAASAAPAGGGAKVWAPSRGYFTVGGGEAAPAAKAGPTKAGAAKPAAAKAPAAKAPAAETAAEKKAPAARKAPAAKKPEKKPAAKPAAAAEKKPEKDPARDSVTTVPSLTASRLGQTVGSAVYDDADSETTLYKVSALNIAFFVSSALLLVYLVLVMWQDYDRPWKNIQADWNKEQVKDYESQLVDLRKEETEELEALRPGLEGIIRALAPETAEAEIATAAAAGDVPAGFASLLASAEAALEANFPDYATLREAAEEARIAHDLEEKQLRAFRGTFMAEKFTYEERKRHALLPPERGGYGDTKEGKAAVAAIEAEFAERFVKPLEARDAKVEQLRVEAEARERELEEYVQNNAAQGGRSLLDLQKELDRITFAAAQMRKNIDLIETNWQNVVRNLPVVDFMAPTYKIDKVVVDDLHEDLQLLTMPRVDRCKTCHINIDNPDPAVVDFESERWGSVYASHPRLDLFVGSASPHPYLEFGCTVCHFGDGQSTDFVTASHTPNSPEQQAEWERKFHWHRMHHQDWPMLEKRYVTSACGKCHQEEHKLEGGGAWNVGYELVRTYGCYGCHKIANFEDEPKAGPNLGHLANKVDRDFAYRWIRNPQNFRYSTRMPRFFDLTNSGGEVREGAPGDGEMLVLGENGETYVMDFHARNGVEALALATYLTGTSDRREDLYQVEQVGDPARGREVFRTSGCLGCHSVRTESMNPALGGTAESLAALVGQARAELAGLKANQAHAALAAETQAAFEGLVRWFDTLAVGQKVAEHYRRVMAPLTKLEQAGTEVSASKDAATAIYSRWVHNTRAPDLSSVGSKIRDRNWLADWIIDPRRHDPDTIMPRLRIVNDPGGDRMIADLVAYLQSLRDPEFEAREVFAIDNQEKQKLLDDLAYDYLRRDMVRTQAKAVIDQLPNEEKLAYVGHRLIRRYGCFGCHNGISDSVFTRDPSGERFVRETQGTMDNAQRIGTELNGWGSKLQERLDYSVWGHQPSGREAIPHRNRYAWLHAKLTDTRRFDVFPNEQVVDRDKGIYRYATTRRLVQKTPEELLKMPRFAFVDEPELLEGVIAFVVGLVDEPIQPSKRRTLVGDDRVLEDGARLIAELNCQGCHRIGAENQYVHYDDLPSFSLYDETDEAFRVNEMEKETWLSRPQTYLGQEKEGASGLELDFGTLLGKAVYDRSSMSLENDDDTDDEPISVVELARRDARAREIPHHSQVMPVAGYQEGGMRFYFGTSAQTRYLAPPPLVRQGERVRSDWLFRFLLDVQPIRPWLSVKMPSFYLTQQDARTIVRWFKVRSGLPSDGEVFEAETMDRELAAAGKQLFGAGGLQCLQCHPAGASLPSTPVLVPEGRFDWQQFDFAVPADSFYAVWRQGARFAFRDGFASQAEATQWTQQNVPAGATWAVGQPWSKESWGPDLSLAAERLRPTWIRSWLEAPPEFMPGTKMPNFFGSPDPMADPAQQPFPGEEAAQKIEALIRYLVHMKDMGELLSSAE